MARKSKTIKFEYLDDNQPYNNKSLLDLYHKYYSAYNPKIPATPLIFKVKRVKPYHPQNTMSNKVYYSDDGKTVVWSGDYLDFPCGCTPCMTAAKISSEFKEIWAQNYIDAGKTPPDLDYSTPSLTTKVTPPMELKKKVTTKPAKTQKAKGIQAVCTKETKLLNAPLVKTVKEYLLTTEDKLPFGLETFARPCPVVPRHGFVDSRIVRTPKQLIALAKEVQKVEKGAEIILSRFIPSKYSATATPSLITIGKGHDGSTAGKGSVTLPLSSIDIPELKQKKAGIKECPYVEAVLPDNAGQCAEIVQLRDGPHPPKGTLTDEWIPTIFKIESINTIDPDNYNLLKWETWCVNNRDNPNNVLVYAPGGNLLSHFAVHCRINNIPITLKNDYKVGDITSPTPNSVKIDYDKSEFYRGFSHGINVPIGKDKLYEILAILYSCHHSSVLTGKDSFYIGMGIALLLRIGTLAGVGELRYLVNDVGADRDKIYNSKPILEDYINFCSEIPLIYEGFEFPKWGGSYGGKAWRNCIKGIMDLYELVRSEAPIVDILMAFNAAVHEAHNGGWWLNKFAGGSLADQIAGGEMRVTITAAMAMVEIRQRPTVFLPVTLPKLREITPPEFVIKVAASQPGIIKTSVQWRIVEPKNKEIQPSKPRIRVQYKVNNKEESYQEHTIVALTDTVKEGKKSRPSYVSGPSVPYCAGVLEMRDKKLILRPWGSQEAIADLTGRTLYGLNSKGKKTKVKHYNIDKLKTQINELLTRTVGKD